MELHPPIITATPLHDPPQHEALYDDTKPSQYSLIGPASDDVMNRASTTNGVVGGATSAPVISSQYSLVGQTQTSTEPSAQPQTNAEPREQQQYSKLDHTIRPKLVPVTDTIGNYESLNFNTTPMPDAATAHDEKSIHHTIGRTLYSK